MLLVMDIAFAPMILEFLMGNGEGEQVKYVKSEKIKAKRRIVKNRVIICKKRGRSGEDASILFSAGS